MNTESGIAHVGSVHKKELPNRKIENPLRRLVLLLTVL